MTEGTPAQPRQAAKARIGDRRKRIRRLRSRVVATALAVFAVAWSVIFFQLVFGHDPGLAVSGSKPAVAASSSNAAASASSPDDSTPSDSLSSHSSSGSSSAASTNSPAPVTTQQS
jgi:cytoskeletal protein RodZ